MAGTQAGIQSRTHGGILFSGSLAGLLPGSCLPNIFICPE